MACIMNAANEAAVAAFLQDRIGFYDITDVVSRCMESVEFIKNPDIEAIFATNEAALAAAKQYIDKMRFMLYNTGTVANTGTVPVFSFNIGGRKRCIKF